MRLTIFPWFDDDFVSLSFDGEGDGAVEDEVRLMFDAFSTRLTALGLGLEDVVRTRMFTRDMDTWLRANQERRRILDNEARSVSSSHVWPERLSPRGRVSIDLLALFPAPSGRAARVRREYSPPQFPLRSMSVGAWTFLSGVTDMTHETLDEQFPTILSRIEGSLQDAGVDWKDVVKTSFMLHQDESLASLRERFRTAVPFDIPSMDWSFVGSRQGKRLEIEVTARRT
jgi:enamine deaminase RidA (YjgF/YER057c/UK114 family)